MLALKPHRLFLIIQTLTSLASTDIILPDACIDAITLASGEALTPGLRICFPDPSLVLNLNCQPPSPDSRIAPPDILGTTLWDTWERADILIKNGKDANTDTESAGIADILRTGKDKDSNTCLIANSGGKYEPVRKENVATPASACVKIDQGGNEQRVTLMGVKQIVEVLVEATYNRTEIGRCEFNVGPKGGGEEVATGCWGPWKQEFWDKGIMC